MRKYFILWDIVNPELGLGLGSGLALRLRLGSGLGLGLGLDSVRGSTISHKMKYLHCYARTHCKRYTHARTCPQKSGKLYCVCVEVSLKQLLSPRFTLTCKRSEGTQSGSLHRTRTLLALFP